jgi:GxxExxY protein
MQLLEQELTYRLRGICIEISKECGHLYKEKVYHKALINKLEANHIIYQSKPKLIVRDFINGKFLDNYYPDFIIEDKIIIEIKVQYQITDAHLDQLTGYLQLTKYELGLLVNFGLPLVQIMRRIYTNDRKPFLRVNNNLLKII